MGDVGTIPPDALDPSSPTICSQSNDVPQPPPGPSPTVVRSLSLPGTSPRIGFPSVGTFHLFLDLEVPREVDPRKGAAEPFGAWAIGHGDHPEVHGEPGFAGVGQAHPGPLLWMVTAPPISSISETSASAAVVESDGLSTIVTFPPTNSRPYKPETSSNKVLA